MALAAKELGVSAVIVMPTVTPSIKVNAVRARGATVVLHGSLCCLYFDLFTLFAWVSPLALGVQQETALTMHWNTGAHFLFAFASVWTILCFVCLFFTCNAVVVLFWPVARTHRRFGSMQLLEESGRLFIPPYDHLDIIAGQGTVGMEILRQIPGRIDAIFVPVGGGGLISGIGAYVKYLRPEIKVIGVESVDSACLKVRCLCILTYLDEIYLTVRLLKLGCA